jgi:hypothetical protein
VTGSRLPRRLSPLTPRWIANQLLQLLALLLAIAIVLLIGTATAHPTDAPAPLDTHDTRTVEPMGHGGPR